MAKTGRKLDKKIGEWFGPCTAAYVLRRLSAVHKGCPLTFYVNQEQSIYCDLITEQAVVGEQQLSFLLKKIAPFNSSFFFSRWRLETYSNSVAGAARGGHPQLCLSQTIETALWNPAVFGHCRWEALSVALLRGQAKYV